MNVGMFPLRTRFAYLIRGVLGVVLLGVRAFFVNTLVSDQSYKTATHLQESASRRLFPSSQKVSYVIMRQADFLPQIG